MDKKCKFLHQHKCDKKNHIFSNDLKNLQRILKDKNLSIIHSVKHDHWSMMSKIKVLYTFNTMVHIGSKNFYLQLSLRNKIMDIGPGISR
jgi:hypothetical protein